MQQSHRSPETVDRTPNAAASKNQITIETAAKPGGRQHSPSPPLSTRVGAMLGQLKTAIVDNKGHLIFSAYALACFWVLLLGEAAVHNRCYARLVPFPVEEFRGVMRRPG